MSSEVLLLSRGRISITAESKLLLLEADTRRMERKVNVEDSDSEAPYYDFAPFQGV